MFGLKSLPALALLLVSIVSNLLMLTGPIFMLQVYDRVLASRSVPTLVALTALVIVLYAFVALLDALRSRMVIRIGSQVDAAWSLRLFRAVLDARRRGQARGPDPIRDLDTVRQTIAGGGPTALLDLPWLPIYLLLNFLLHPALGMLSLVGGIIIAALAVVNEFALRGPNRAAVSATARRQQLDDDARGNAEAIRAMGMLGGITGQWRERVADLTRAQQQSSDAATTFASASKAFRFFLQSAVLALGAYLVIIGEITGGVMIGASMIAARALAPIEQVVGQWRNLLAAREAISRIQRLLAGFVEPEREVDLPLPKQSLRVINMATGPSREVGALVAGVNFELKAGDGLGILGLSGSGKSSLIRALVGIWPVMQGEVRLDGAMVHQYDPDRLGQAIGYLPQVVDLFSGTIAQNIARFRADAPSEAIIEAARQAGVHDLILSFKEGYDKQVGDLGSRLSAGQRQRIGLARALFGNPFLIVLDEPNSNLDSVGDQALTDSMLAARRRGAITVIVAHRPSAIMSVNKLLFVQDGRQAQFGNKEEVLAKITQAPTPAGPKAGAAVPPGQPGAAQAPQGRPAAAPKVVANG